MITKILEEWSEYCGNMGSVVIKSKNVIISKNSDTTIACDFANCVISLNTDIRSFEGLRDNFKNRDFKIYSVTDLEKAISSDVKPERKASLMVLEKKGWLNKYRNEAEARMPEMQSYSIFDLAQKDLYEFGNVVFEAFNYERALLQQSIDLYRIGLKSGMVHYYGLKLEDQMVSCALLHNDAKQKVAGLELVSTRPKHQNMGFSKILVAYLLSEMFSQKTELVWLFAIDGGIAERFYYTLGFKKIGNISIKTVNGG